MVQLMILAEVTIDGDLSTYAGEALLFLFLVGGALFFLTTVVLAQNPIASDPTRRKFYEPKEDSLSAGNDRERKDTKESPAVGKRGRHGFRASDKRRSLRRGGNPVPVIVSDTVQPQHLVQGLVLNRSRGGLSLSVAEKLEVGRLVSVRTPDFPDCLASVALRVRHCKQRGDNWQIGCQFMEELPWSVLLMFG